MTMPYVFIKRVYPDKDEVYVQVAADSSYADALDEARAVAIRTFREAVAVVESTFETEPEQPGIEEG